MLLGAVLLFSADVMAHQTTLRDLRVMARAVSFAEHINPGRVSVAVGYDPINPQSFSDAQEIVRMMASGLSARGYHFVATLESLETPGLLRSYPILIVAGEAQRLYPLLKASLDQSVIISSDPACLKSQICMMEVISWPSVEIVVSRAIAQLREVSFSSAFLMMIREVE
jgi:hypothetical protein